MMVLANLLVKNYGKTEVEISERVKESVDRCFWCSGGYATRFSFAQVSAC